MIIYIDSDYKCYTKAGEGLTEIDTTAFDGKCTTFIEGYRFVPRGQAWIRSDGMVFKGEMMSPHKPLAPLLKAQMEYELEESQQENTELVGMLADIADKEYIQAMEEINNV